MLCIMIGWRRTRTLDTVTKDIVLETIFDLPYALLKWYLKQAGKLSRSPVSSDFFELFGLARGKKTLDERRRKLPLAALATDIYSI